MTRMQTLTLGVVLASGWLGGCSPSPDVPAPTPDAVADAAPSPAPVTREQEPNEDREHANPLAVGGKVTGHINAPRERKRSSPLPDQDWFRVDVPAGPDQVLRAVVSGVPAINLRLECTDVDGNDLVAANVPKEGGGEVIPNVRVAGGATVYFRVRELWVKKKTRKFDEQNAYEFSITARPHAAGEESEPNDRMVDATPLPAGRTLTGYLGRHREEDWFRLLPVGEGASGPAPTPAAAPMNEDVTPVTEDATPPITTPAPGLPAGLVPPSPSKATGTSEDEDPAATPAAPPRLPVDRFLRISLSGIPDVRPTLAVVDEIGTTLVERRAAAKGEGVELRDLGLDPAHSPLYLVLRTKWEANPEVQYALSVQSERPGRLMELEPNDGAVHATTILDGQVLWGYLHGVGDEDWYRLEVEEPSQARLALTGVEGVNLRLAAYREGELLLREVNEGRDKEPETMANLFLAPGTPLFVKVHAGRREANGETPYSLLVSCELDTGRREREPNDEPAQATPITLEQTLRGYIQPRGDRDDYLLDLSAQPRPVRIRAQLSGIAKVNTDLLLLGAEPDEEGNLPELARAAAAPAEAEEVLEQELAPGRYLLRVVDDDGKQANPRDEYLLTVTRTYR